MSYTKYVEKNWKDNVVVEGNQNDEWFLNTMRRFTGENTTEISDRIETLRKGET